MMPRRSPRAGPAFVGLLLLVLSGTAALPEHESGDLPDTTDVAFGPRAGDARWVETYAVAEHGVTRVQARVDGGAWHGLTLRPWGAWAGSFHVPDGSVVEFRATTADGTDTSHGFVWPRADAVGGDGSWPEEGSYLRYATHASDLAPSTTAGHRTAVRHDGAWWVSEHQVRDGPGGTSTSQRVCVGDHTPRGPTDVAAGDRVRVQVGICHEESYDVVVRDRPSHDAHGGGAVAAATWHAERTDACLCLAWDAGWDRGTGIVVQYDRAGRGGVGAHLLDTDAPA